ncbi:hypothetical protein [Streptomyces sp. NPDC050534]|uniref:hypothetical protein n=1 Tax=Streptomyces sp. NPDC050534 TaxID=3365625 RepID=UPI0037B05400
MFFAGTTTDDNVWVTGVLVVITPIAVALVLLPFALAPMGVLLARLHERLDGDMGRAQLCDGSDHGPRHP